MKVHFFYYRNYNPSWHCCRIEAWEENDNTYCEGKQQSSFKLLEKMHVHISKSPIASDERKQFHCCDFEHDYGTDSCNGHWAKNRKDFLSDKAKDNPYPMTAINQRTFERFRKVMLSIYLRYPLVDYQKHIAKEAPACRIFK